jgi:Predicted membrane protein (DUF2306)
MAWVALFTLCAIAIAAVVHRMVALAHPMTGGPAAAAALDAAFAHKSLLTLVHIVAALGFVLLVPLQFWGRLRARHPRVHRWTGRVVMTLAPVIGLSALLLLVHPIGGIPEVTAILFFDGLFLFAMGRAFFLARRRQFALHREWVMRGVAVALGAATVRPIMGVFFAISRGTGWTPHQFFGIAFWIGFAATVAGAEVWIRRGRV